MPDQMLLAMMTMEFRFVVPILYRSGAFRSRTIRRYLKGPTFAASIVSSNTTDEAAKSYSEIEALKPVVPLLERAKADCEVAIVSVFSGMSAVALDQMRDVMDRASLRIFATDLDRLQTWANASPNEERDCSALSASGTRSVPTRREAARAAGRDRLPDPQP
jgi:hypothetical protein